jgi:Ca2+-binding RTX toxin-like protein
MFFAALHGRGVRGSVATGRGSRPACVGASELPAVFESTASSGNPVLDAIDGGRRWAGQITYNRVDSGDGAETAQFQSLLPAIYTTQGLGPTDGMWAEVSRALSVISTYADVRYAFTSDVGANYLVSDFYRVDSPATAGIAAQPGGGGVMAFNRLTWDGYSGQLQQWIALHEVTHTLGLRHVTELPGGLDYSQFTIMSYNWYDLSDPFEDIGLPLTPMALDVAVLQAKYGAVAANAGATTYRLGGTLVDLDGADGVVRAGTGYVCIWDTGGEDTMVLSGAAGGLINLNAATLSTGPFTGDLADVIGDVAAASRIFARLGLTARADITSAAQAAGGFFSSVLDGGARAGAGFTIAHGAVIEAAAGGEGADLIIGNAADNRLTGNGGADDLFGGSGQDSLDGGAGDDAVYGGLGNDTITDSGGGSNYLRGDEGDDSIAGGAGFDDINGNMGSDTLAGGAGDDWVVGGKDGDLLSGGDGADLVYGNLGADTLRGDGGNDIVRGGQQDDVLFGGDGDDYLSGDRDSDTLTGGAGADIFHSFSEAGLDRVLDFNLAEGDRVLLDAGTTYTTAQVGGDTVITMSGGQVVLVGVSLSSLTGGWITVG